MQQRLEKAIAEQVPEVKRTFARTGTAEIAADPMPPNISDSYVMLKPKEEWPDPDKSREQLIEDIQKAAASVPCSNYEMSQPIQLRFNELISGVRSDVAVKVFGDDMDILNKTADDIAAILQDVPCASEVKVEQTTGLPLLSVNVDRDKAARFDSTSAMCRILSQLRSADGKLEPSLRVTAVSTSLFVFPIRCVPIRMC